ncbi:putative ankyrin repeat protein [Diplonema papillatum]|nr:putative ankyrin repeat protein [Diplonema papillatum]
MASQLLFHAVNQGDLEQVQCLLVEGCADVNYRNTLGETVVHVAATRGLVSMLEMLLANGSDPNVARHEEYGGYTPLHIAAATGALRVAEALLARHMDPNIPDAMGMLPLHLAARSGNQEFVLLLITHGSKPDAVDDFGKPPAYYAQMSHSPLIMRLLPTSTYNWREQRAKEKNQLQFIVRAAEPKPEKKKKGGKGKKAKK